MFLVSEFWRQLKGGQNYFLKVGEFHTQDGFWLVGAGREEERRDLLASSSSSSSSFTLSGLASRSLAHPRSFMPTRNEIRQFWIYFPCFPNIFLSKSGKLRTRNSPPLDRAMRREHQRETFKTQLAAHPTRELTPFLLSRVCEIGKYSKTRQRWKEAEVRESSVIAFLERMFSPRFRICCFLIGGECFVCTSISLPKKLKNTLPPFTRSYIFEGTRVLWNIFYCEWSFLAQWYNRWKNMCK